MGHPLGRRSGQLIMYALLAGVTGGYQQHVPSVPPALLSSSSPQFGLPQAVPSRSRGAFMWAPTWRAPVTAQTWAPRRERRRPIFMWLFTSIRSVASLPVRVSVAVARAMRSMCLYLQQSWSALSWPARYDRSLPGARGSKASLPPSPRQQRVRDARLQTLIRLDQESLVSSLTKCACPRHAAAEPHPAFPRPTPRRSLPRLGLPPHTPPAPARASQDTARPDKASR